MFSPPPSSYSANMSPFNKDELSEFYHENLAAAAPQDSFLHGDPMLMANNSSSHFMSLTDGQHQTNLGNGHAVSTTASNVMGSGNDGSALNQPMISPSFSSSGYLDPLLHDTVDFCGDLFGSSANLVNVYGHDAAIISTTGAPSASTSFPTTHSTSHLFPNTPPFEQVHDSQSHPFLLLPEFSFQQHHQLQQQEHQSLSQASDSQANTQGKVTEQFFQSAATTETEGNIDTSGLLGLGSITLQSPQKPRGGNPGTTTTVQPESSPSLSVDTIKRPGGKLRKSNRFVETLSSTFRKATSFYHKPNSKSSSGSPTRATPQGPTEPSPAKKGSGLVSSISSSPFAASVPDITLRQSMHTYLDGTSDSPPHLVNEISPSHDSASSVSLTPEPSTALTSASTTQNTNGVASANTNPLALQQAHYSVSAVELPLDPAFEAFYQDSQFYLAQPPSSQNDFLGKPNVSSVSLQASIPSTSHPSTSHFDEFASARPSPGADSPARMDGPIPQSSSVVYTNIMNALDERAYLHQQEEELSAASQGQYPNITHNNHINDNHNSNNNSNSAFHLGPVDSIPKTHPHLHHRSASMQFSTGRSYDQTNGNGWDLPAQGATHGGHLSTSTSIPANMTDPNQLWALSAASFTHTGTTGLVNGGGFSSLISSPGGTWYDTDGTPQQHATGQQHALLALQDMDQGIDPMATTNLVPPSDTTTSLAALSRPGTSSAGGGDGLLSGHTGSISPMEVNSSSGASSAPLSSNGLNNNYTFVMDDSQKDYVCLPSTPPDCGMDLDSIEPGQLLREPMSCDDLRGQALESEAQGAGGGAATVRYKRKAPRAASSSTRHMRTNSTPVLRKTRGTSRERTSPGPAPMSAGHRHGSQGSLVHSRSASGSGAMALGLNTVMGSSSAGGMMGTGVGGGGNLNGSMSSGMVTNAGSASSSASPASASNSVRKRRSWNRRDRRTPSSGEIEFVNFTANDGHILMTGVAPSGSSKTKAKREREALEGRRRISEAAVEAVLAVGGDPEQLGDLIKK